MVHTHIYVFHIHTHTFLPMPGLPHKHKVVPRQLQARRSHFFYESLQSPVLSPNLGQMMPGDSVVGRQRQISECVSLETHSEGHCDRKIFCLTKVT